MVEENGQAGADVEITQEMIDAGVRALRHATIAACSSDDSEALVRDIFEAMFQLVERRSHSEESFQSSQPGQV